MAFFDPTRPAYLANPYPALARLRSQEPVHWSANLRAWVLTRYDECARALHDASRFTTDPARTEGARAQAILAHRRSVPLGEVGNLGTTSGEQHRRIRQVVNPVFSPAAVRDLMPVIEAEVEALLGALPRGEPVEFMTALANPLPRRVMYHVMGLPANEAPELQRDLAAIEVTRSNPRAGSPQLAAAALERLLPAFARLTRDSESSTNVFNVLGRAVGGADGLSSEEALSVAAHIATVGADPTSGALGNAVVALAANPAVLRTLRLDHTLLRGAVHELLRYDSPTHFAARFAMTETELGGRRMRRGDAVLAVVGAANRDPAAFDNPDELDLSRDARKQLAFGQGEHICLGAPLALAILETALRGLLGRFEVIELLAAPKYGTSVELRIPDRVELRFA